MELQKDFREFIELLNNNDVKYLVIGGYAVNFHGYPRYTKDIDFWIWLSDENIEKLLKTLKDFGFGSVNLSKEDFLSPGNIIQLGFEPLRIDLIVQVEGSEFKECFENKKVFDLSGLKINFLGLNDLIIIKKNAGRLQDLADAEQLENLKKESKKKRNRY